MSTVVTRPKWKQPAVNTPVVNTEPPQPSVNTDRHKPGYMAEYMRQYRKRKKAKIEQV